jgi:Mini-chromosome maintenance protein 2
MQKSHGSLMQHTQVLFVCCRLQYTYALHGTHLVLIRAATTAASQVEDGEDLMENMDADYVPIAELDQYDPAQLDRREYGDMDYDQRQEAERVMRERDQALGGRLGGILDEVTDTHAYI